MNPSETRRVRVAVTHAGELIALGICAALGRAPFEVCLVAAHEVAGADPERAFDLVVADPRGAVDVLCRVAVGGADMHAPKVLVVATVLYEPEVRLALQAGVHGYVMMQETAPRLRDIVDMLLRGARYVCPLVCACLSGDSTYDALTQREREVLQLLSTGKSNKLIARELGLAVGTVKAHVRSIMDKLNAGSRTEAASVSIRRGLTTVPGAEAAGGFRPAPSRLPAHAAVPGLAGRTGRRPVPLPRALAMA